MFGAGAGAVGAWGKQTIPFAMVSEPGTVRPTNAHRFGPAKVLPLSFAASENHKQTQVARCLGNNADTGWPRQSAMQRGSAAGAQLFNYVRNTFYYFFTRNHPDQLFRNVSRGSRVLRAGGSRVPPGGFLGPPGSVLRRLEKGGAD